MTDDVDKPQGNRAPDRNAFKDCQNAGGQIDRPDFEAAVAAVDAARAMTTRMAKTGISIEDLGSEFLAERRALADLMVARHRMHELTLD